jgi:hypothetical protein
MSKTQQLDNDKVLRSQRLKEAAHLQKIEGNPLDAEDWAMFEMFEREGFSPEEERAYILARPWKPPAI